MRLNVEPAARELQEIAVGIDPGSKREGFTVASEAHTYLNIQATAVDWVKDAVETRRMMRRNRRNRKCPHRACRRNRSRGGIPPSTKARWQLKLRLATWITKMYPVRVFVVEDVAAKTKSGKGQWNRSFSPLEAGKRWFYIELQNLAPVSTRHGWETKQYRDGWGLSKGKNKLAETWETHCVDSWVLTQSALHGTHLPDNKQVLVLTPLRFHRRQLHMLQFAKGGKRKPYGSTRSLNFKRGSYVKHPKWGVCYMGGTQKGRVSLHSIQTGKRLCTNAKVNDTKFLTYASWRTQLAAHPHA